MASFHCDAVQGQIARHKEYVDFQSARPSPLNEPRVIGPTTFSGPVETGNDRNIDRASRLMEAFEIYLRPRMVRGRSKIGHRFWVAVGSETDHPLRLV